MCKYSPDQPRDDAGRFGEGSGPETTKTKSERSKAAYNPSSKDKQDLGDASQRSFAAQFNGTVTPDNAPMDVTLKSPSGRVVGIEVKTLCDQKDGKITIRKECRELKEKWGRKEKAAGLFVVAYDKRDSYGGGAFKGLYSGKPVWVGKGIGSYRIGGPALKGFDSEREAHDWIMGQVK
jgi:hypothetical protein